MGYRWFVCQIHVAKKAANNYVAARYLANRNTYHGDRLLTISCQELKYSVSAADLEGSLLAHNVMILPVPMHKFEPRLDGPRFLPLRSAEVDSFVGDLIVREQETRAEQILVIRIFEVPESDEWQPKIIQPTLSWVPSTIALPAPTLEIGQAEPYSRPPTSVAEGAPFAQTSTSATPPSMQQMRKGKQKKMNS